jgi:hypothetical protein
MLYQNKLEPALAQPEPLSPEAIDLGHCHSYVKLCVKAMNWAMITSLLGYC